jgi:hypothetical protein
MRAVRTVLLARFQLARDPDDAGPARPSRSQVMSMPTFQSIQNELF